MVTDAGHFPHAAGHRVERPQGVATHLLIACLSGSGWIRTGGANLAMRPGQLAWLPAHLGHAYGSSEDSPWTISWAHFSGEEVAAWQTQLGWAAADPVMLGRLPPDRMSDLRLERVYDWLEHGYSLPQLFGAAAALRATFCAAIQLAQFGGPIRSAAERVAAVLDRMRAAPAVAYRLQELAAAAHLSIPHFSELFRRQTGYAPIDYLIRQRIRQACQLLDTTLAPIGIIAADVGYADPYYFTRAFRQVMGLSPRAYRQVVKG
jgi:AraC-like DNA-binding protein